MPCVAIYSTKAASRFCSCSSSGAGVALAQYRGYSNGDPFAAPQQHGLSGDQVAEQVAKRFIIDVAAAVLGFIIGAFFSPKLRPVRRLLLVVLFVAWAAFAWFGPDPFADWAAEALAVLCFFVALGIGLRLGVKAAIAREEEPPTSFGTAKWATEAYLQERGLFEGKGFFLGEFLENGSRNPLHYDRRRHLLTVAPTRSGKGVASIIPNLLTYQGSVFIIDPKGENAMITAGRRGRGDQARANSRHWPIRLSRRSLEHRSCRSRTQAGAIQSSRLDQGRRSGRRRKCLPPRRRPRPAETPMAKGASGTTKPKPC